MATGAFDEYGRWDKANDNLLKNDEALKRSGNAGRAVLGAIGAAAGFGGAALTAPACVTVVGCAAPAFSGLGGALSFHDGMQATGALLTPYQYTQGSKIKKGTDLFSAALSRQSGIRSHHITSLLGWALGGFEVCVISLFNNLVLFFVPEDSKVSRKDFRSSYRTSRVG
ncbi:hypothetical protein [Pseudomonas edaphica]|uniref:hypothetical protein n=1 Tax=Pseudomonas edaphica TaxID=2006980 RepID=UPI001F0DF8DE|nr:hypothetical protein [Pseudomonas edaphica]